MMVVHKHEVIVFRWLGAALVALSAFVHAEGLGEQGKLPLGELTEEELVAEPHSLPSTDSPSVVNALAPVTAANATDIKIEAIVEFGYVDELGRYAVDLLEQDYAYLSVRLETADGHPVIGAVPVFSITGTSKLLEPKEVSSKTTTDESGVIEFAVVGGRMGLDRVRVELGDAGIEILINVISLQAAGFPMPPVVEGGVPWVDLMQARIRYHDMMLHAEFPASIKDLAGQTVKLSGFMMPLDPDLKQSWFLLTSNPPSCFFHIPGGPAGAVEVFAKEGIEMSWDSVVLEGRFEPQSTSEIGVV
jgi:hypothetical protein